MTEEQIRIAAAEFKEKFGIDIAEAFPEHLPVVVVNSDENVFSELYARKGDILECKTCKKAVYRMKRDVYRLDPMDTASVEYWNGEQVKSGDPIACPHCRAVGQFFAVKRQPNIDIFLECPECKWAGTPMEIVKLERTIGTFVKCPQCKEESDLLNWRTVVHVDTRSIGQIQADDEMRRRCEQYGTIADPEMIESAKLVRKKEIARRKVEQIGRGLGKRRKELGRTQEEISAIMGVCSSQVRMFHSYSILLFTLY